jgi:hypothetical protein
MTAAKRKIFVSIDADLVEELEAADVALSAQVNEAVRDALERRRQRLLVELLADLDRRNGPIPEKLIAKYEALLS